MAENEVAGIEQWYAGKTRELVRGCYKLELGEIRV